MRVLIVGSRGMLGTELMAEFSLGYETQGVDLQELDITQLEQCLKRMKDFRPDIVINAAAFTRVDDCETRVNEAYEVNGYGPGNLAKAAAVAGSVLVHYSTDYIFDGTKREPYVEDDAPNPRSVYGKSKLLGETLVREHCSNHLILRTSWLFGRNGPNFIRTIIEAANKGASLRVVDDQIGSPSYARDVAAHTRMMIASGCRSTYHVTNSGSCTWYDLAQKSLEWAGLANVSIVPVPTSGYPRPAPRPANSVLSNARLEQDGLPPMRRWEVAVKEYVTRYLSRAT